MARSFIDTNILVYADDAFDPRKQQLALDLVVDLRARQEAVLSTQVLQDYFFTATHKLGLEAHFALQRSMQFGRFELIQPTLDMLLAAMDLQQNHSLSFWDALTVQTAAQPVAQCSTARTCRPGQGLVTFSLSIPSRDSRARETPSNVQPRWSLLAIRSMRTTACIRGVVCSAIFRGDAELKAGPQATTGRCRGALSYPQQDVSAEGASISLL